MNKRVAIIGAVPSGFKLSKNISRQFFVALLIY